MKYYEDFIARIGPYSENGGWRPHLHLQVISEDYYRANPNFDAYAAENEDIINHTLHPITLLSGRFG